MSQVEQKDAEDTSKSETERFEQWKRIRKIYQERVKSIESLLRDAGIPENEW